MTQLVTKLTSTFFGRIAVRAVRPLVRLVRRFTRRNVPAGRALREVTYGGRRFTIEYRRPGTDFFAIDQCFSELQYDMPGGAHGVLVERIYQGIVASGRKPLIIDCGSNIGTSVLWFSARYPKSHMIAIEPAPDNVEMLRRNCAALDVDIRQAGVAAADGHAYLSDPGMGEWGYRTVTGETGVEVEMVSIGKLLASKPASLYTPFLLKIDIEGAEKTLFEGDCSEIDKFPLIILEPHDWLFPGQLLSRAFFRFHVASGREFCVKHENVASIAFHESLLEMPNARRTEGVRRTGIVDLL